MTVTEPRYTTSREADARRASSRDDQHRVPADDAGHCAQCHAPLAEDQEWCLECGSSRTLIYAAPDWRVPVVIALVVILLAIGGFAFAITRLSDNSASAAQGASAAVGSAASLGPAAAGAGAASAAADSASQAATVSADGATTRPGAIASWPVGLSGWTVVLDKYTSKTDAFARAHVIAPRGTPVGVFDSNDHPALKPGFWVVFSGRFPNRYEAAQSAAHLIAEGYTTAVARQVAKPGGL
jgi:hypothetical protein